MRRNNPLKSKNLKKVNPATNPATLNVVTFSFRAADEYTAIQGSTTEWKALDSKIKKITNK